MDARCEGLPNVASPPSRWTRGSRQDGRRIGRSPAILLVNLLHLISDAELAVLLDEASRALRPGGLLALYGPFLRDGTTTSEGDARFHGSLRRQESRDRLQGGGGCRGRCSRRWALRVRRVEMPANNLMLLARRGRSGV